MMSVLSFLRILTSYAVCDVRTLTCDMCCCVVHVQINEAQSSFSHTVGVSSQVGTYGGGFFVRPNTIDFADSLAMFLTPWENPIGLILVGAIFILFFILLYWALRQDKKDVLLVRISQCKCICIIIITKFISPPMTANTDRI